MEFTPLETTAQVSEIKDMQGLIVIFKHNTTCPISKSVRGRFEQEADSIPDLRRVYFLDLLAHRDVSDAVADQFDVPHESPQLLLIKDGKCIYNESMYNISAERTAEAVA